MSSDQVPSAILKPTAAAAGSDKKPPPIPGMPSVGICSCGAELGARCQIASGISRVSGWLWWIADRISDPFGREEVGGWLGRTLSVREHAEASGLCPPCLVQGRGLVECEVIWKTLTSEKTRDLCYQHSLAGASALASRLADALPPALPLVEELRAAAVELAAAAEQVAARKATEQESAGHGAEP